MTSQNAKILVIEDDDALAVALEDTLTDEGMKVTRASSGEEGFSLATDTRPDLILLDILLDEMSGVDILKKLRTDENWGATVPIIIMTSMLYLDNLDEIKQLANAFVFKGNFELAELVDIVHKNLDQATDNNEQSIDST